VRQIAFVSLVVIVSIMKSNVRLIVRCLNIAASIIADHGRNWEEEVLPSMRKGFSHFRVGDDGDGAKELSVQESIITASLNSIGGSNADRTKKLFVSSAVFGKRHLALS
jgi:hypothetical protein